MEITFLGHAAIKIKAGRTIYIDPFLTGNPQASLAADQVTEADVVVVTHDHGDHLGDAFPICHKTGAVLVAQHEIAEKASAEGLTAEPMNIGGTVTAAGIKVHMVQALHTAGIGNPTGVVVEVEGKNLYHAGDTGLTLDMKIIGEFFHPELSFIPIGDRYTMGIDSAAKAVEYCQTKKVIPVHYNTFPIIMADPEQFKQKVGDLAEVIILAPGETYSL